MKKIIIYITICILLGVLASGAFYIQNLKTEYITNELDDTISINIDFDDGTPPYHFNSVVSSIQNATFIKSLTPTGVYFQIFNSKSPGIIMVDIGDSLGEIKKFIINVKPSQGTIERLAVDLVPDFTIGSFSGGEFEVNIHDGTPQSNILTNINYSSPSNLVSFDGEFIFSLVGNQIIKQRSTLEEVNSYDINFVSQNPLISSVTDIKSINGIVYLRINNGDVFQGIYTSGEYLFSILPTKFSDIGINNFSLTTPTGIGLIGNTLDYEIRGNILYRLSNTLLEVSYLSTNDISKAKIIYTIPNNNNFTNFYVTNYGIYLINITGATYHLSNHYNIYLLKDINGKTLNTTIINQIINFRPNLSSSDQILITTGLLNRAINQMISTDMAQVSYTPTGILPGYDTNNLAIKISPSDFVPITKHMSYKIDKFSSSYGFIEGIYQDLNITIPIVGYGISFSTKGKTENINPKLNLTVNNVRYTPLKSIEGYTYLHIKAYDYGMNMSSEIIKGPLIVMGRNPQFTRPVISNNHINITGGSTVEFMFTSTHKLGSANITLQDDNGNKHTYGINDIELVTGETNLTFLEELTGKGEFTYIIPYSVAPGINKISFYIAGRSIRNQHGYLYHEYNFNSGWFQVLGVSKTNSGLGNSLSIEQKEKGFVYGVESKSNISSDINTDYKFNSQRELFSKIPLYTDQNRNGLINFELLKSRLPEFNGKIMKEIDLGFFYKDSIMDDPIINIRFPNGYYHYFDGDLLLKGINFYGNGLLLIKGNLDISEDIIRDLRTETLKYGNSLKIYVTGNINIFSNVTKIDSFLFSNKTLSTLSISHDIENPGVGVNSNIFGDIDGKYYYDLNKDGRVDLITFKYLENSKRLFHVYILGDDLTYLNNQLTSGVGLIGDYLNYSLGTGNTINGKLVSDIVVVNNGQIDTRYFINQTLNGLILQ